MSAFVNGFLFPVHVSLTPPPNRVSPFVKVDIAAETSGAFCPVIGKLDTGAYMTVLNYATAIALGIPDPQNSHLYVDTGYTSNGQPMELHVHQLLVRVPMPQNNPLLFPILAGFSDSIRNNLFGIDWTSHFCLAFDYQEVHLLRE